MTKSAMARKEERCLPHAVPRKPSIYRMLFVGGTVHEKGTLMADSYTCNQDVLAMTKQQVQRKT